MSFEDIVYEAADGIATVAIDRPKRLNALREQTLVELAEGVHKASDDPTVGVVVIRGLGGRAFSAGGDQKDLVDKMNPDTWRPTARKFIALFESIRRCPSPVIAAVQGWAIGGGNELATFCDLTIASASSRFGQVGPKVGAMPMFITQILPRAIGDKRAKEVFFLCEQYDAEAAKELGLVNFVVADEDFDAELDALCQKILDKSPTALRVLKMGVNFGQHIDEAHTDMLIEMATSFFGSPEQREGTEAYQEKRDPDFRKYRRPKTGEAVG
jgi:dihydroxynaphthoic acid synthetase